MPDAYVYGAAQQCVSNRCMAGAAQGMVAQALDIIEEYGRNRMSQALWCDQSGHAFSERDPGRQRIKVSSLDESEQETEITKDFCGDCAAQAGLTSPRKTRPALRGTVEDSSYGR